MKGGKGRIEGRGEGLKGSDGGGEGLKGDDGGRGKD
jgi:hypothetical protein